MGENRGGPEPREQQIAELLLQGCSNAEIARQLRMNPRTVKAHFNRLFQRFGISGGIKRVKLATFLYRRSLRLHGGIAEIGLLAPEKYESLNQLPKIDGPSHKPPSLPSA